MNFRSVSGGVALNLAAQAWALFLGLAVTPVLVSGLGAGPYGVLALAGAAAGYLSFLNAGFGPAALSFIARSNASGDREKLGAYASSALFFLLSTGLAGAALLYFSAGALAEMLPDISAEGAAEAASVLRVTAFAFAFASSMTVFSLVPKALGRFDLSCAVDAAAGTATAAGSVLAAAAGWGAPGVAAVHAAGTALSGFAYFLLTRRLLPGVRITPSPGRAELRELAAFGRPALVSQAAGSFTGQFDRAVLGAAAPISELGVYAVPSALAQKLGLLQSAIIPVVFPAASARGARGGGSELGWLYLRALRLTLVLSAPAAAFALSAAGPFLSLWIGPGFPPGAAAVLRMLTGAFLLASLSACASAVAQGAGRPGLAARWSLLAAAASAAALLALAPRYGGAGAAAALLLAQAVSSPPLIFAVGGLARLEPAGLARGLAGPVLSCAALCLPAALILPGAQGLAGFFARAGLLAAAYFAAAYFLVADGSERDLLRRLAGFGGKNAA